MSECETGLSVIARFLNNIASLQASDSIYRGQANTAWEPIPSIFRHGIFGLKTRRDLARWKALAGRFERAQTDLEWLVLAQHYGVATALLDWTTNPLVALFFAAQSFRSSEASAGTDGAVFMIPSSATVREDNPAFDVFTTWNGPPLLVAAETMNKRSLAQASVMTLHCEGNHFMTPGHNARIFIIPHAEKAATLTALRRLGFGAEGVYDDINTAAREFADQLSFEGVSRAFEAAPNAK